MEEAHERKKEKYEELVMHVRSVGGGPTVIPLRWGERRGECVRG